jgi:hypothetical protein
MKYWDCINVPGKTDVEGAKTSAPSSEETHVLAVGNIEPSMTDVVTKAAEEGISITHSNEYVDNEKVNELSDEYKKIFNQAFNKGEVKVDPVPGTDAVSVSVPANLPVTTEKTPEEPDAKQGYVSVDEVDVSQFDTDGEFEVPEVDKGPDDMILEVSHPTEDTVMVTETRVPENSEDVSEQSFDKNALLESIFSNGGEELVTSVAEKVVEPSEPTEVEYVLDEKKYGEIIDTLNKYEEEYFKEIPIKHISNRFLRNISKAVFRAHEDAVIKYEDPPLMDPIFLLYPLTTEDPYMAMGKFWSIVTEKISNNRSWTSAISKSVEEYEEYMRMEAEEEDDDADEDDGVESNNE